MATHISAPESPLRLPSVLVVHSLVALRQDRLIRTAALQSIVPPVRSSITCAIRSFRACEVKEMTGLIVYLFELYAYRKPSITIVRRLTSASARHSRRSQGHSPNTSTLSLRSRWKISRAFKL